jgi:hypothetical protein
MVPGTRQLRCCQVSTPRGASREKRTRRITVADDFEVLEGGEIRELGRKGRGDSREDQLSTITRKESVAP